jgi:hypothetical protein
MQATYSTPIDTLVQNLKTACLAKFKSTQGYITLGVPVSDTSSVCNYLAVCISNKPPVSTSSRWLCIDSANSLNYNKLNYYYLNRWYPCAKVQDVVTPSNSYSTSTSKVLVQEWITSKTITVQSSSESITTKSFSLTMQLGQQYIPLSCVPMGGFVLLVYNGLTYTQDTIDSTNYDYCYSSTTNMLEWKGPFYFEDGDSITLKYDT